MARTRHGKRDNIQTFADKLPMSQGKIQGGGKGRHNNKKEGGLGVSNDRDNEMKVGACGRVLDGPCFPDIEDDLCLSCEFNGYNLREDEGEGYEE